MSFRERFKRGFDWLGVPFRSRPVSPNGSTHSVEPLKSLTVEPLKSLTVEPSTSSTAGPPTSTPEPPATATSAPRPSSTPEPAVASPTPTYIFSSSTTPTLVLPQETPPTSSSIAHSDPLAALSTPDDNKGPVDISERLWNQAYDGLKAKDASNIDAYEKILSRILGGKELNNGTDSSEGNKIAQHSVSERRRQMRQVIDLGLEKTAREAKIKGSVGEVATVFTSTKNVIGAALQAAPQAALPWAVVSVALEMLVNPITQTKDNRDGIDYVRSRMEWYCALPQTLLKETQSGPAHGLCELQHELECQIVRLYEKLLLYEINSILSYHRNRGLVFLRDLVKLEDWKGDVNDIRQAEIVFSSDTNIFTGRQTMAHLGTIVQYHLTEKDNQCIKDVRLTDPRRDKTRIESTKGGLLQDSFRWILGDVNFLQWRDDEASRLLWIKGDPGKGKTMLLCGIIDELEKSAACNVCFFFFQATESHINNSTSLMRSLIYMLATQQPSLVSHVREEYDRAGKELFTDTNAWFALSEITKNMLHDPTLTKTYIVIDALDECETGRSYLLDFIAEHIATSPRIKCIVSSRNLHDLERGLSKADASGSLRLSLELNADLVSSAVNTYIDHKVAKILSLQDDQDLQRQARDQMRLKADGTFLWVALVCQHLQDDDALFEDAAELLGILHEMPSGLTGLYDRMVQQITRLAPKDRDRCRMVMSTAALAYRPIHLSEIPVLADIKGKLTARSMLETLVSKCGSFLTIRNDTIYFVHLSAKDHLLSDKAHGFFFPNGTADAHRSIATRLLRAIHGTLRRNMYDLSRPGLGIEEIRVPSPDPLAVVRYSCIYWMGHICQGHDGSGPTTDLDTFDVGKHILHFLQKDLLHWLEALSLLRDMSGGVAFIARFESLSSTILPPCELLSLIRDACRFVIHNRWVIEKYPLQTYHSALLFAPTQSVTRLNFGGQEPSWVTTKPQVASDWSAHPQTIESDTLLQMLALSSDGKLLATQSNDYTIYVWDVATGNQIHSVQHAREFVGCFAFSNDAQLVVSGTFGGTVGVWNVVTGTAAWTIQRDSPVASVAFSNDSLFLAVGFNGMMGLWNVATEDWTQTLEASFEPLGNMSSHVCIVDFSGDSKRVAAAFSWYVKVWDVSSCALVHQITVPYDNYWSPIMAFSTDLKLLAVAPDGHPGQIVDIATGAVTGTFGDGKAMVSGIKFSEDSRLVTGLMIMGRNDINIWDVATGALSRTINFNSQANMASAIISKDSSLVAVKSSGSSIDIWNVSTNVPARSNNRDVVQVRLSDDAALIAVGFRDGPVEILDAKTMHVLHVLEAVILSQFSRGSKVLVTIDIGGAMDFWEVATGALLLRLTERVVMPWCLVHTALANIKYVGVGDSRIDALEWPSHQQDDDDTMWAIDSDPRGILGANKEWIYWNGEKALWLPYRYRPWYEAACSQWVDQTIALGCQGGFCITIGFSGPPKV